MKMHDLDDIGAQYWVFESRFGFSAWAGDQILGRFPSLDEAKAVCGRHKAQHVLKGSRGLHPVGIFHVTARKIEPVKVTGKSNAQLARERFDSKAWGVRR